MKAPDIRKNAAILTILFFGGLAGMGGYIANMHPDLMETWEGLAMIGAPAVLGLIFLMVSMLWKLDIKETPTASLSDKEKEQKSKDTMDDNVMEPESGQTHSLEETMPKPETSEPGITVVQVLGVLQREGRLIDFLLEDITPYSDDQIGAAVREVHKGCRKALMECFKLAPVIHAGEGSDVEVDEDFDPVGIKLTGNVHGKPPFRGVLRHSGWRYTELKLPEWSSGRRTDVIAPAEVEIS